MLIIIFIEISAVEISLVYDQTINNYLYDILSPMSLIFKLLTTNERITGIIIIQMNGLVSVQHL